MVLLILGCFSISWLPYCILVYVRMFSSSETQLIMIFYKFAFILVMANSGMNPFIYAWKNANFRRAFQKILHFKSPNSNLNSSFKVYLEKQRELKRQQTNTRKNNHINENSNSYLSDQQSNQNVEENKIDNTAL